MGWDFQGAEYFQSVGFFNLTYLTFKQSRRNDLTREIIKLPKLNLLLFFPLNQWLHESSLNKTCLNQKKI